jgi:predicted site-specific integrase-resolvase
MVFKEGAFVAGQMAMVVKTGKDAEKILRARISLTEEEKENLTRQVETGKIWAKALEEHKKKYGL